MHLSKIALTVVKNINGRAACVQRQAYPKGINDRLSTFKSLKYEFDIGLGIRCVI